MYSAEEKRSAIKRAAVRVKGNHMVCGHSFSTYVRFFLRLTFLTLVSLSGGKKCYFLETFTYVLNE